MFLGLFGGPFQKPHIDDTLKHGSALRQYKGDYPAARGSDLVDNSSYLVIYVDIYNVFLIRSHVLS